MYIFKKYQKNVVSKFGFIFLLSITLEQFNTLTSIDTFSCLGGREVTLLTEMRVVPCSMSGSVKDFMGFLFCFVVVVVVVVFLVLSKIIIYIKVQNSCYNVNSFKTINILQNMCTCTLIKSLSRYRRSIFKENHIIIY